MHNFPTQFDIERLKKQENGDRGFYFLSLFSFIESYLRSELENSITTETFYDLFEKYERKLKKDHTISKSEKNNFCNIQRLYKFANDVRHQFKEISDEELLALVSAFWKFFEDQKVDWLDNLTNLKDLLKVWDLRTLPVNQINYDYIDIMQKNFLKKIIDFEKIEKEINYLNYKLKLKQPTGTDTTFDEEKTQNELAIRIESEKTYEPIKYYLMVVSKLLTYTKTRRDYESYELRFSKSQQDIFESIDLSHDVFIKGGAGSGKSLILIKLLEKYSDKNIQFLTYNRSLRKYEDYIAKLELDNVTYQNCVNKIGTIDSYILKNLQNVLSRKIYISTSDTQDKLLEPFLMDGFSKTEIINFQTEIYENIWAKLITDKQNYFNSSDKDENYKEQVWQCMDNAIKNYTNAETILSYEYALFKFSTEDYEVIPEKQIDYLIIDEVQDLNKSQLKTIRKIVKDHIIIAGDVNQSILQQELNIRDVGFDFTEYISTSNFRNSNSINDFARMYLKECMIKDDSNITNSFRAGPLPELYETSNMTDTYNQIIYAIHLCINIYEYSPSSICVIAPNNEDLKKISELLMQNEGLSAKNIKDTDFSFENKDTVRLSSPVSVKGIDFPVVILMLHTGIKYINDTNIENTIYTCITRALDLLQIFIPNTALHTEEQNIKKFKESNPDLPAPRAYLSNLKTCYKKFIEEEKVLKKKKKIVIKKKSTIVSNSNI